MDRRRIEQITASLAVTLLFFITISGILFIADLMFNWDIFPPDVEKFLGFILLSCLAMIASSVLVNIMINLSIVAHNMEKLADKHPKNEL